MSQAPKRDPLKPTRCAYLIDDLADSIVSLNFSRIKSSLSALRECHKNKSINADREEKPKYVVNDRKIPTSEEVLKYQYETYQIQKRKEMVESEKQNSQSTPLSEETKEN